MRVMHIIPMVLNYFDDMLKGCFRLVEGLQEIGIDVDAVTLQLEAPTKARKEEVVEAAPSREYVATETIKETVSSIPSYDIVHVHCPMVGGGSEWYNWRWKNPKIPMVVTYHHDLRFIDLFSLYIKCYNRYYVPKFFAAADIVTCLLESEFKKSAGYGYLKDKKKVIPLIEEKGGLEMSVHLTGRLDEVQLLSSPDNFDSAIGSLVGVYSALLGIDPAEIFTH